MGIPIDGEKARGNRRRLALTANSSNCVAYGTECVYTDAPRKRAPPRGAKYIQNLEERLQKMEELLRRASPQTIFDPSTVNAPDYHASYKNVWQNEDADESQLDDSDLREFSPEVRGANGTDRDTDELAERMGVLLQQPDGEAEYLGASNTVTSLFSAQKQIRHILGDNSFDQFCDDSMNTFKDNARKVDLDFMQSLDRVVSLNKAQLPDQTTCQEYIDLYFDRFQHVYPLLDESEFNQKSPQMHKDGSSPDVAFSTIYLMVLAFGSHIKHQQPLGQDHQEGFKLYTHAHKLLSVIVYQTSLPVVQAFILVSLYLDGINRAQALWTMLGPLVRMAQSLGLHRRLPLSGANVSRPGRGTIDGSLLEARRRAFWIIYLIDNNLVVTTGKPAAIQDFDCDQELPTLRPQELAQSDGLKWADGKPFSFFLAQLQLAKLSHQVQKRLYCVRALESLSGDRLETVIAELDLKLLTWLQTLPEEFRPENTQTVFNQNPRTQAPRSQLRPLYLNLMIPIMHLRYFNLMMTIHRRNMVPAADVSRPGSVPPSPGSDSRASSSHSIAVHAARSSLAVLSSRVPRMEDACMKMNIAYPIAATLVLFANLVRNPASPSCNDDVQIMKSVTSDIAARFEYDVNTKRIIEFLSECIKISEVAISKAHQQGTKRDFPQERPAQQDPLRPLSSDEFSTYPSFNGYMVPTYPGLADLPWTAPEGLHDPYAFGDFTGVADPFGSTQIPALQAHGYHLPMQANHTVESVGGLGPIHFPGLAENVDNSVDDTAYWQMGAAFTPF